MQLRASFILILCAQLIRFPSVFAQCPLLPCHPAHDYRAWKIESLELRSSPSRSRLYASFDLYRTRWNGFKYYTVPTPNSCNDPSEFDPDLKLQEWNICSRVNLAPDGEELFPKELQRWLKWQATEFYEQPNPQNSSLRDFKSAKFEVMQGLPWPVYVPFSKVSLLF